MGSINRALRDLRALLFMDLCIGCYKREPISGKLFCLSCYVDVPYIKTQESIPALLIGKADLPTGIEAFYSLMTYSKSGLLKTVIDALKYRSRPDIGIKLGRQLADRIKDSVPTNSVLIPVPLHPKRQHERGYNQAHKIAQGLSEHIGVAIDDTILKRIKYNESQTKKSAQERKGVKDQKFALSKNFIIDTNQHAIIVDDIITTGSTISACYYLLNEAGYEKISVATLAITI